MLLEIVPGTQTIPNPSFTAHRQEATIVSIAEVVLPNCVIYVFPGSLSPLDILIKYKNDKRSGRLRTPKHIHWAIDFLLKKQGCPELASDLLKKCDLYWGQCKPLRERSFSEIKNVVDEGVSFFSPSNYEALNKYGEYDVEFLCVLMILLSVQEKTNYAKAFMFGKVIEQLLADDLDIFRVASTATHNGR